MFAFKVLNAKPMFPETERKPFFSLKNNFFFEKRIAKYAVKKKAVDNIKIEKPIYTFKQDGP
jgi:hypothetical protein